MKAIEAKAISEQNARTIEWVYEQIEAATQRGDNMITVPSLAWRVKSELMDNGYSVSHREDPIGFEFTKITW